MSLVTFIHETERVECCPVRAEKDRGREFKKKIHSFDAHTLIQWQIIDIRAS